MKLYIFGASGSGVTTLGKHLAEKLGYVYLDSDDYLWEKTEPPYTTKRDKGERNTLLIEHLKNHQNVILGGSIVSWGIEDLSIFNLAVFLYLPVNVRLERLKQREHIKFGELVESHPIISKNFAGLIDWAAGYDTDAECGRGLPIHEKWIKNAPCPVIEIRNDISVDDRVAIVVDSLNSLKNKNIQ